VRLRDILPVQSPDKVVIAKTQEMDAILLSMNGDCGHRDLPSEELQGNFVAIQMRNHAEVLDQLMVRLTGYLKEHSAMEYFRGKLVVVEVNRIRIRE
jgi:hypothetical protein